MSYIFGGTRTFLGLICATSLILTVRADTLEGTQLEAYDAYCPAGNQRAVWAEPLPGRLAGWVKLVCLNEDEQATSGWYVTPEGDVVLPDEAELPVYVRPFVDEATVVSINALSDEESIRLWLDFRYNEPTVPSIEDYGAPAGIAGVSGSATTSPNGITVSTYELNGQAVTQAEYDAWQTNYLAASRAQNAERDRLIHQQVQLALYELVDLNRWHNFIDVDAINNGYIDDPFWQFNSSLVITLTGQQARELLQTSEGLVYVSTYPEISTTDGGSTTGEQAIPTVELPMEPTEPEANDEGTIVPSNPDSTESTAATMNSASGGSLNLLVVLLLMLSNTFIRRS